MYAQRRDTNEPAIIAALTAGNDSWCQQMDKSAGYDLIWHGAFSALAMVIEIKMQNGKLTPHEQEVKAAIEAAGGLYSIVRFEYQARALWQVADRASWTKWDIKRIRKEIEELDLV